MQFKDILQPKKFEIDFYIRTVMGHNSPEEKYVFEEFIDNPYNMNMIMEENFYDEYGLFDNDELHIDGIQVYNDIKEINNGPNEFDFDQIKDIIIDAIKNNL